MAQGIKSQGVTPADVAASVIRETDDAMQHARMDVHEVLKMASKALAFIESGKLLHAMALADTMGNISHSVARRLQVIQTTRNTARKVAAPEKW
jgi:hypothetical protein